MHILGLLHAPDVGGDGVTPELLFDGRDVVTTQRPRTTRIRAREMGFVFQDFNLFPTLTALENVVLAADYAGTGGATGQSAAIQALDRVVEKDPLSFITQSICPFLLDVLGERRTNNCNRMTEKN